MLHYAIIVRLHLRDVVRAHFINTHPSLSTSCHGCSSAPMPLSGCSFLLLRDFPRFCSCTYPLATHQVLAHPLGGGRRCHLAPQDRVISISPSSTIHTPIDSSKKGKIYHLARQCQNTAGLADGRLTKLTDAKRTFTFDAGCSRA